MGRLRPKYGLIFKLFTKRSCAYIIIWWPKLHVWRGFCQNSFSGLYVEVDYGHLVTYKPFLNTTKKRMKKIQCTPKRIFSRNTQNNVLDDHFTFSILFEKVNTQYSLRKTRTTRGVTDTTLARSVINPTKSGSSPSDQYLMWPVMC